MENVKIIASKISAAQILYITPYPWEILKRIDPETEKTSHYLPNCHCGGRAKHWLQIINAANIWHWVECLECGKYTELTRSRELAEQDWRDIISGIIRAKKVHWDIPF